jgi:methyl-accepting chemotaxis protein
MLKSIANLPISRRLFIAFALAAILPSLVSGLLGFYFITQRGSRGGVIALTFQAQSSTTAIANSLDNVYNQVKELRPIIFMGLNASSASTHPTVPTSIQTQVDQIHALTTPITKSLANYNAQYNPLAPNMKMIKDAKDESHPDDTTDVSESTLLNQIIGPGGAWLDYQAKQQAEIDMLQQGIAHINALEAAPSTPSNLKELRGAVDDFRNSFGISSGVLDASDNTLTKDWDLVASDLNKISSYVNLPNSNINPILFTSIGVYLIISILIIFVGFTVQKSITGPLTELVSLTKRISKGDTNARVTIGGHDEISIVANAMNNMLDNIVHLIQETQSQRDVLQGQVEKLVSEVSGVGEGDLRVQAEVTADALGVLADSFNYMVEELGSLVVRVKMVAREVEESTTMTSDRMSELVEAADRQIQQITTAALEIERMAVISQQVASRTVGLSSSAREARMSAQGGRQAVQQTIEGMGRISINVQETSQKVQSLGESSREINNIVEAISTIAHQTNRLALDAAIQAAMAGDNGKGFGAVAADIRRLAERAKEQATTVGRIVRSVRDEIGSVAVSMRDTERETAAGAKLAEEAGTSLESIFSVIERQAREIDGINQMAMQQQQSSDNVVQIMQGVSESTQESSTSTREAAQNMERIARLAEQLLASVEAFKLRESLNYLAPNVNVSVNVNMANRSEEDGPLTLSGTFRTVTATAQPISNGGSSYVGLPAPNSENGFSQFSPAFFPPGSNNSQPSFPPLKPGNGQQFFTPQGAYNGQQAFSQPGQFNSQESFPQQGQGFSNGHESQEFFPQQEQGFGNGHNDQEFFPQLGQGFGNGNGQQAFPQPGQGFGNSHNGNGQQAFSQPGQGFSNGHNGNGQQAFSQPGQGFSNGHNGNGNGQQAFSQPGQGFGNGHNGNGQQAFSQPGQGFGNGHNGNGQQAFSQPGQGFGNGQQGFGNGHNGNGNGQQAFSQPGQGFGNGQQAFPQHGFNSQPLSSFQGQGANNLQQPFPQQGNRVPNESQWPDLNKDGQSGGSSNW